MLLHKILALYSKHRLESHVAVWEVEGLGHTVTIATLDKEEKQQCRSRRGKSKGYKANHQTPTNVVLIVPDWCTDVTAAGRATRQSCVHVIEI